MHRPRDRALSEMYGYLLLVILLGIIAVLIVGIATGFVTMILAKPPVFAVDAKTITLVPGKNAIGLISRGGDPVELSTVSAPGAPPQVLITLESPQHTKVAVAPSEIMTGHPWSPGGTATVFYDGSAFRVTDDPAGVVAKYGNTIRDMPSGTWLIYITDVNTRIVVNSLSVTV